MHSIQTQGAITEISILQQDLHMLTDLYQFHSRALQQPRSASFPWHLWRNYLVGVIGRFHSFSIQPNTFHTGHSLSLHSFTTITIIFTAETSSWTDSMARWFQLYACMYISLKQHQWNRKTLVQAVLFWSSQSSSKPLKLELGKDRLKQAQCRAETGAKICQCLNHSQTEGLAEIERAVTLLTFNTHTLLTQHIAGQSQWPFRPCCSKT